jgi:phage protein D
VRRPVWEVTLGSGGAADWSPYLIAVVIEAGIAPSVDSAEVYVAEANAPSVALTDVGSLALGYEDSAAVPVFTGEVQGIQRGLHRVARVTLGNGGAKLAALRLMRSYEQQKAGDIVSDLAGELSIDTDTIENGAEFPFYLLDAGRSGMRHLATLARQSDYLAYFTGEGKLNFLPYTPGTPVQTFVYGQDIITMRLHESVLGAGAVTVTGEGAAGGQGSEAWAWLVKDPASVQGAAGSGTPARTLSDSSLRSADAAQAAAGGVANAADQATLAGELLVPGAPAAMPGTTVEVKDAPHVGMNGKFLVRYVRHVYSKRTGFTSQLGVSKAGAGSGGLAGGLLDAIGGLL